MGELKLPQKYTFQEYLAIDEKSDLRYEYINGEIRGMAGSSINHNTISLNVCFGIRSKLSDKGSKCKTLASDVRVQISPESIYYYPDVVLSCEKTKPHQKSLSEPILIAEVLSESTNSKDMGEKLFHYLQINSLQYYLIISQNKLSIHLYERTHLGWGVKFYTTENEVINFDKIGISLSLTEIYSAVEWDTVNEP